MEVSTILIIDSFDGRQILGLHSALLPDSHTPQGSIQFLRLISLSKRCEFFFFFVKRTVENCNKPVDSFPAFTNARVILRCALNFSVHFETGKTGNSPIRAVLLTHDGS